MRAQDERKNSNCSSISVEFLHPMISKSVYTRGFVYLTCAAHCHLVLCFFRLKKRVYIFSAWNLFT